MALANVNGLPCSGSGFQHEADAHKRDAQEEAERMLEKAEQMLTEALVLKTLIKKGYLDPANDRFCSSDPRDDSEAASCLRDVQMELLVSGKKRVNFKFGGWEFWAEIAGPALKIGGPDDDVIQRVLFSNGVAQPPAEEPKPSNKPPAVESKATQPPAEEPKASNKKPKPTQPPAVKATQPPAVKPKASNKKPKATQPPAVQHPAVASTYPPWPMPAWPMPLGFYPHPLGYGFQHGMSAADGAGPMYAHYPGMPQAAHPEKGGKSRGNWKNRKSNGKKF